MVSIRELTHEDGAALAEMLNGDALLRADLGIRMNQDITAGGVLRDIRKWCGLRTAVSYAILADGVTVGMISLSHIDPGSGTGCIGYWVGSSYREHGYCKLAFKLVLHEARCQGLHTVSATIDNANMASRKLWHGAGGSGTPVSAESTRYEVRIDRQQTNSADR